MASVGPGEPREPLTEPDSSSVQGSLLLTCSREETPKGAVVRIQGEIDLANAGQFQRLVFKAIEKDVPIILDLSHVTYLNGKGLRVLETCGAICRDRSLRLALVLTRTAHRLISLVGLDKTLEVFESVEAASRALPDGMQRKG